MDGGINGGLIQANKEVVRRGVSASDKTIAADIARRDGGSKRKSRGKIQAEAMKNLKIQQGNSSIHEITSRAFSTWGRWEDHKLNETVCGTRVKIILTDPLKLVNPGVQAAYVDVLMGGVCLADQWRTPKVALSVKAVMRIPSPCDPTAGWPKC